MPEYADISELDDRANYVRVTWRKMINYASTFTKEIHEIEEIFKSGKYGPQWTFARWLGAKCGMSERTTYRVIAELHKVASDDQRERTQNKLAEVRRLKAQLIADRRATQLAWNDWVDTSKAAQDAWDQYQKEEALREKGNVKAAQDAWDQYWLEVKEDAVRSQTAWDEHQRGEVRRADKNKDQRVRRAKAKKEKKNKKIESEARFSPKSPETEKPLPNLAEITDLIERLVALLCELPPADRVRWLKEITVRLEADEGAADDNVVVAFPITAG